MAVVENPLVDEPDRAEEETPEDELDPVEDDPDDAVCVLGVAALATGAEDATETGLPGPPGRSGPASADGIGIGAFAGAAMAEGTVAGI